MNVRFAKGPVRVGLMLLVLQLVGGGPRVGSAQQASETPTIRVNGQGVVTVQPDLARVSFAVETQEKTAREASEANADLMDAVIRALRGSGTAGLVIETHGYSLNPVYSRQEPNRPPRIEEYRASNQVSVEVPDLDAVGALLDVGISAGANRIAGLSFAASEAEGARLEAVAAAVLMARAEAEAAAAAAGVELGPIMEMQVNSQVPDRSQTMMRGVAFEAAATTPIEAAGQRVTANVTILFGILQ